VSAALGELQTELRQVMLQLGAPTIADLTADLIAP
jgi:isopentenyl diphosphate isomerase/L-lactate dehydrogenase-like FMN-dependent dehydrogenase